MAHAYSACMAEHYAGVALLTGISERNSHNRCSRERHFSFYCSNIRRVVVAVTGRKVSAFVASVKRLVEDILNALNRHRSLCVRRGP